MGCSDALISCVLGNATVVANQESFGHVARDDFGFIHSWNTASEGAQKGAGYHLIARVGAGVSKSSLGRSVSLYTAKRFCQYPFFWCQRSQPFIQQSRLEQVPDAQHRLDCVERFRQKVLGAER